MKVNKEQKCEMYGCAPLPIPKQSMKTNMGQMSCGGCGNGTFRVYRKHNSVMINLYIECNKCKSISIIKPSSPQLDILWSEEIGKDLGILAPMEEKSAV